MAIEAPYYPIVYVRGYAATMSEIEDTVATPYMGFNLGSTKLRQNYEDAVVPFIFESPVIRLRKDEEYVDAYRNGDFIPEHERVDARSIWIFRYYEQVSEDLGDGKRKMIPEFARQLRQFILRIRRQVCGDDQVELAKFKVHLVAHSMGGLICRCYLQNICKTDSDPDLGLPGDHLVDKVFTYATPHNGIDMAGINAPNLGAWDPIHIRNFNRKYMREYLNISSKTVPVSSLDGALPPERCFCFVGTNYKDYEAFLGLSKRATGPLSDGLVMMKNASVYKAPRAFAHRSHSGHYGIVNSEEGYQNLRRFLFGQVRVDCRLMVDEIVLPPAIEAAREKGKKIRGQYNIEVSAKVRGAGCFLNQRRESQESAIRRRYEDLVETTPKRPVYLFTGYLHRAAKAPDASDTALAFAIQIGVVVPLFEVDNVFWFDDYYEDERFLQETITFHIRGKPDDSRIRYGLASEHGVGQANTQIKADPDDQGRVNIEIPLGFKEGAVRRPRPGFRGRLLLTASPW